MNKHINHLVLWLCTGLLSLVLVGAMLSCVADPDDGGGVSGDKTPGDLTATYYDVGDDCGAIEVSKKYIPKDTAELKRLIQRDIQNQGADVNLNYIDTSGITDMSSLFTTEEGASFDGSINCWDVSKVENMSNMFLNAEAFNQDINSWKVDNVKKMDGMFAGALAFNQDISNWKVDKVVDMQAMFSNTDSFNKDINSWNVSNVATMRAMFRGTETFNQDISDWNVGAVTTMESMFAGAKAFDKSLTDWNEHVPSDVNTASMFDNAPKVTAIPDWKEAGVCFDPSAHVNVMKDRTELKQIVDASITTSTPAPNLNYLETCNVTDMSELFKDKTTFTGDISQWDVSNVTDMQKMFDTAQKFNRDLSKWNVSKVKKMNGMFAAAATFDQPIGGWTVGNVEDMSFMFSGAKVFDQPIEDWTVGKVTTMQAMFRDTEAFKQDISKWDVGKVTNMSYMFQGAIAFDKDLSEWSDHVSLTVTTVSMFFNAPKVTAIPNWTKADGTRVCFDPSAHVNVMRNRAELKEIVDAAIAINQNVNLNYLETCNVTDMSKLFEDKTTFNGDVTKWDTSKVKNMERMFWAANVFNQDISAWSVNSLTNVYQMLGGTLKLCGSFVNRWREKVKTRGLRGNAASDQAGFPFGLANC